MYIISVMVCFMSLTSIPAPLCFPSTIPVEWKTITECRKGIDNIIKVLDEDMKERRVSLMMKCIPDPKQFKGMTDV